MKRHVLLVMAALVLGIGLGQVFRVDAQSAPGKYTECFATTVWVVNGKDLNGGEKPKELVRIPSGWTVVSGTQYRMEPGVVLCR